MCKFNIIENAQEFSDILLHCDEAVNCLAYDYNKHLFWEKQGSMI
jgi:hypothetical protein